MNLNGISNLSTDTSVVTASSTLQPTASSKGNSDTTAVVYEKASSSTSKTYTPDTELINKLKKDADDRTSQLRSLVEKLITKQGQTYRDSFMWNVIREGDYTVDEATVKQAKEDISEEGYWGVKQTSDRIISFAKALTGGDPSKIETMKDAVENGFKAAKKLWGDELPDISQQTYDAVIKGFDEWSKELSSTDSTTNK